MCRAVTIQQVEHKFVGFTPPQAKDCTLQGWQGGAGGQLPKAVGVNPEKERSR